RRAGYRRDRAAVGEVDDVEEGPRPARDDQRVATRGMHCNAVAAVRQRVAEGDAAFAVESGEGVAAGGVAHRAEVAGGSARLRQRARRGQGAGGGEQGEERAAGDLGHGWLVSVE